MGSRIQIHGLRSFVLEDDERPEQLYQRLITHLKDNLLTINSSLTYDGAKVTKNKDTSPTVVFLVVLHWMEFIHPSLPALVQRTFSFDLETMSLKDLQPQICVTMDGLL